MVFCWVFGIKIQEMLFSPRRLILAHFSGHQRVVATLFMHIVHVQQPEEHLEIPD